MHSAGHRAKSTSRHIMTQNASKVESLLMSGQKNHLSLTVQLQNIILRRNARRKNNGARLTLSLRLPTSTSVQVVIHRLVTMKCSGMHANTVCCASVHIQRKKLTAQVYLFLTYCSFWHLNTELERQLNGVWAVCFFFLPYHQMSPVVSSVLNAVGLRTSK